MTTQLITGSGARFITDPAAATFPAWQPGRKLTLSNTVGGFSAAAIFGIPPNEAAGSLLNASQLGSFIWNGVQFCRCPDSGSGSGFEIYFLNSTAQNTQHRYNAVEPGKSGESPPLDGTTNLLAQGFTDATGKNALRVVKPAFWNGPGENSTGPIALNMRDVSETIATITYTWGLAGNDHIIQMDHSIVIPADPVIQAFTQLSPVPFFNYCPNFAPKAFTTQEWVHLTTGATRSYTTGEVSTTEVLMNKTADDNFACAQVFGAGMLGSGSVDAERGYRGLSGAGPFPFVNTYAWCSKVYAGGIPAGTLRAPVGWCFGTRADLIGGSGAIVTAFANLPAASYPT